MKINEKSYPCIYENKTAASNPGTLYLRTLLLQLFFLVVMADPHISKITVSLNVDELTKVLQCCIIWSKWISKLILVLKSVILWPLYHIFSLISKSVIKKLYLPKFQIMASFSLTSYCSKSINFYTIGLYFLWLLQDDALIKKEGNIQFIFRERITQGAMCPINTCQKQIYITYS